ncbi:GNAT family N-acetyltransferase [Agromyces sp. CFH 90414]|uniref:GNAT family N-acetyltransferase n=2 Tax=Agromyces agglutinans TaxID=2662258 RepID=A0A6I2FAN1_9MICO|nr:GNAT family N-acetyltransferase [Agromyces agglutinans]
MSRPEARTATAVPVRPATETDAAALAVLAAETFPLACPPHTTRAAMDAFVAEHLSAERFKGYVADPSRLVLVARGAGAARLVGYTMLVFGEPHDADVAAAIRLRPTVELSKCYALPGVHGSGVSSTLMAASLDAARARADGAPAGIWLGVNQENLRAQRFYGKHGFERVGTKRFLVGERWEDDYVYERAL